MIAPDEVLKFWIEEVGPKGWYNSTPELDQTIRDRFGDLWQEAREGACGFWLTAPLGALSYIILTDQFPRNMFRDAPEAFELDPCARAAAKGAIERDWDMKVTGPARQFFYLPLMHSENLSDQDRCIRLMATRLGADDNLLHAKVHREIIRKLGRFPFRNAALSRATTAVEKDWIEAGGYGAELRAMQETV